MGRFDPLMLVESTECPPHEGLPAVAVRERGFVATELTLLFTITQQTAKNLFLWEGRSFVRKGLEAWFVFLMEGFWPKKRILEVYPNIVEFGDGVYGVHSAAVIFFDKEPSHLTRREAALLAAVLPNPKRFSVTALPGIFNKEPEKLRGK